MNTNKRPLRRAIPLWLASCFVAIIVLPIAIAQLIPYFVGPLTENGKAVKLVVVGGLSALVALSVLWLLIWSWRFVLLARERRKNPASFFIWVLALLSFAAAVEAFYVPFVVMLLPAWHIVLNLPR